MKTLNGFKPLFIAAVFLPAVMLSFSCDENPADGDKQSMLELIRIHSGNNQSERTGAMLSDPLTVKLIDILNNPKPGVEVRFSSTNPGAVVNPASAVTDSKGLASCTFKLGTEPGVQHVKAATYIDSTLFSATAEVPECDEEDTEPSGAWPSGHIFITTTSSSLIDATGSVILDVDPQQLQNEPTLVLETDSLLIDLAFSTRGELYVSTAHSILKVDPQSYEMDVFVSYTGHKSVELEPNSGGVLAGVDVNGLFSAGCPSHGLVEISSYIPGILWENLAAHPLTRDLFTITGSSSYYRIIRGEWDGRSSSISDLVYPVNFINAGQGRPNGMCIDSTGTVFVTVDGNDTDRRISKISADGTIYDDFFDFYAHAGGNSIEAGRWGDITLLDGYLYLVDTRNDRLVVISTEAVWTDDKQSHVFSKPGGDSERYGIAASPKY